MQLSIFAQVYDTYKSKKPLRLIELFAGYGSQALALKYMGVPFEHYRVCEWNWKSNYAYSLMHDLYQEYDTDMTKDEIIKELQGKGLSADWNKPMEDTQIARMKEEDMRHAYNAIRSTRNTIDISRTHGSDLGIEPRKKRKREYLMTYSFPCQDLSLAGERKGMEDGTGTRSSLLWQVERILNELSEADELPDILLMENVPQVHGMGNENAFRKWCNRLTDLGYSNFYDDVIATDYEIPQTRNRCMMISILGKWNYQFLPKKPLVKKLKDFLEAEVDTKYYLTQKQLEQVRAWDTTQKPLEQVSMGGEKCQTITAKSNTTLNYSPIFVTECIGSTRPHATIYNDGRCHSFLATANGSNGKVPMVKMKKV